MIQRIDEIVKQCEKTVKKTCFWKRCFVQSVEFDFVFDYIRVELSMSPDDTHWFNKKIEVPKNASVEFLAGAVHQAIFEIEEKEYDEKV